MCNECGKNVNTIVQIGNVAGQTRWRQGRNTFRLKPAQNNTNIIPVIPAEITMMDDTTRKVGNKTAKV